MKFKVGDRVKVRDNTGTYQNFDGGIGVVKKVRRGETFPYEVDFSDAKPEDFHTMYDGMEPELLERPIVEEKAMGTYSLSLMFWAHKFIYVGGKTILLYSDTQGGRIRRSIAKCHPDDNYDRSVGEDVAYYRAAIKACERKLKGLTK